MPHNVCKEMQNLRDELDKRNIKWEDDSDFDDDIFYMERTIFTNTNGDDISVIHGYGSYGGWNRIEIRDKGLLEVMVFPAEETEDDYEKDIDEIFGYLTADKVIERFL